MEMEFHWKCKHVYSVCVTIIKYIFQLTRYYFTYIKIYYYCDNAITSTLLNIYTWKWNSIGKANTYLCMFIKPL